MVELTQITQVRAEPVPSKTILTTPDASFDAVSFAPLCGLKLTQVRLILGGTGCQHEAAYKQRKDLIQKA